MQCIHSSLFDAGRPGDPVSGAVSLLDAGQREANAFSRSVIDGDLGLDHARRIDQAENQQEGEGRD